MTARALRVGVLLGENLVEEKLFSDALPITIGQSLRCRLSVPVEGMPMEHVLFARDQGRLLLRLTTKIDGRLAQGDTIKTELREGAGDNGVWTIPLERGARGKLKIGDATILFQEVAMPARTPRPQLPASVRGTFADRIDRRLAVIVGSSLIVHLAIGLWAWVGDVEANTTQTAQVAAQYRHETYDISIPDEPPAEPGAANPSTNPTSPTTPIAPTTPAAPRTPSTHTPSAPHMTTTDEAERFAQILTGNAESNDGPGGMSNRTPGSDLGQQVDDIRTNGRTITVGNENGGFRQNGRDGIGDGRNRIVDGDPKGLNQTAHHDEEHRGRIDLRPQPPGPPPPPGTTPTPDQVVAKIKKDYMAGLMRCYQIGLRDDGSLAGKVAVTFTIAENGKLSDRSANGVSPGVDSCISSQMASWRFPAPKDNNGESTEMDFGMSLALVPSN